MIVLGQVSGVYGVKGWLKIYSYTDPIQAIVDYSPWYIRHGSKRGDWQPVELLQGKRHGKTVIVQIPACESRDDAQLYTGYEIAIKTSQLLPLDGRDEFYWSDLIGLKVVNLQGITLGKVSELMETGANDVLVVTSTEDRADDTGATQRLIPWSFNKVIIAVDLDKGQIEVDWQAEWCD